MNAKDHFMPWSGCLAVGKQGTRCYSWQPRFFLYPLVVIGHPGVNARMKLFCTAITPADHTKQPKPVANLAYQRTPGVSLQGRHIWKENQLGILCWEDRKTSSLDLLGIPGRHPGSSQDDWHKTCCQWSCLHNSPHVDTHHPRGC